MVYRPSVPVTALCPVLSTMTDTLGSGDWSSDRVTRPVTVPVPVPCAKPGRGARRARAHSRRNALQSLAGRVSDILESSSPWMTRRAAGEATLPSNSCVGVPNMMEEHHQYTGAPDVRPAPGAGSVSGVLAALLLCGCGSPALSPSPSSASFTKPVSFAILEDYDKGTDLYRVTNDFELFRELGVTTWRGSFGWDDYEPEP